MPQTDSEQPPQFVGGGPEVVVKNTFLDYAVEEPPPQPSLMRAKTAPAAAAAPWGIKATEAANLEDAPRSPVNFETCSTSASEAEPSLQGLELTEPPQRIGAMDTWGEHCEGQWTFDGAIAEHPWSNVDVSFNGAEEDELVRTNTMERWDQYDGPWSFDDGILPKAPLSSVEVAPSSSTHMDESFTTLEEGALARTNTVENWGHCDWQWAYGGSFPPEAPLSTVETAPSSGTHTSHPWFNVDSMAATGPVAFLVPAGMVPVASAWPPAELQDRSSVDTPVPTHQVTPVPTHQAASKVLTTAFNSSTGTLHVNWKVDARKFRSNDKQAVSPSFDLRELFLQVLRAPDEKVLNGAFKLVIQPRPRNAGGTESFKKANGHGIVQLKCESDFSGPFPDLTFCFAIGRENRRQGPCAPFKHNFAVNAMAEACRKVDWDFSQAVDPETATLDVELMLSLSVA